METFLSLFKNKDQNCISKACIQSVKQIVHIEEYRLSSNEKSP